MRDYYDPSPRLALAEPLVLAGPLGAGTAAVARAMAARTGVGFFEVDRVIENAAGRSLARIAADEGPAALAGHAAQALERALERRPCAIVAIASAWVDVDDVQRLLELGRFVALQRPPAVLFANVVAQCERTPGSLFQFALARPKSVEELGPLQEARAPSLGAMHVAMEAGTRHANEVASELLDALDRLVGVDEL